VKLSILMPVYNEQASVANAVKQALDVRYPCEIELVVGVRNMAPDDLVPWAPPGARVPTLEEPLGEREIRGVVSHGMLCSPRELAISGDGRAVLEFHDARRVRIGVAAGGQR